ncbi:Hsp70 family protein [Alkalibacterium indicireducens]|uniref:Chaperone protein DnaK n=2 Tax=Alkalibacterium indicireducens TaxID=398758 RepID=A0ABP3LBS1_9LACT
MEINMTEQVNYYMELAIDRHLSAEELDKQLKAILRKWRNRTNAPDQEIRHKAEKMMEITEEAMNILTDPDKKNVYDKKLTEQTVHERTYKKIGIDLGTTNSAVAYIDEQGVPQIIENREGDRTTPSVLLYEDGGFIVGVHAKEASVDEPENTVQYIKRQMGEEKYKFITEDDTEFKPEELSAIILKRLKKDAEDVLGEPVHEAVITVPAYFDDAQRKATQDAGKIAGLNVLKIINEPTAAALAYSNDTDEKQNVLVYDLGGGTFDITVMEYSPEQVRVLSTAGDRNLGGFDFDNEISKYFIKKIEEEHGVDVYDDDEALQDLRVKSEEAKKTLSSRNKAKFSIYVGGQKLKAEITREEFQSMTQRFIDRTALIMEDAIEDAGLEFEDLDKVLLVGGSTRMPAVEELIKEEVGITPSKELNPDEIVAMGAAIQAEMIDGKSIAFQKEVIDVNAHSLGLLLYDNNVLLNDIVVPKNSVVPAEGNKDVFSRFDNQEELRLQVTEGEDTDPEYVKVIGDCLVKIPQNQPAGYPIETRIAYDENGVVHVRVFDGNTQDFLGEAEIERTSNLTQKEVDELENKISDIRIH